MTRMESDTECKVMTVAVDISLQDCAIFKITLLKDYSPDKQV